jgi:hypothetical protein
MLESPSAGIVALYHVKFVAHNGHREVGFKALFNRGTGFEFIPPFCEGV